MVVTVRRGTVAAPDSIRPGWTHVRVEEDREGHILVIFRLPPATTDAEVASWLAALDTAATTPHPGVAMGGPEIGAVGDVIVKFTPGKFVLGCVRRGADGHRHASSGESKVLLVSQGPLDPTRSAPPHATQTVRMSDFAYYGPDKWAAGSNLLRVENTGTQDHQLRLVRLRPGKSIREWMDAADPNALSIDVAGVARMSAGQVAYLPVELTAGAYVAYCLVADPKTGRMHVMMGMLRAIQVE
jgi:hypothetical protein